MKRIPFIVFILFFLNSNGQGSFLDYQKKFPRFLAALKLKEDTLQKQFAAANLQWPPQQLYIRSFKYDSQLEVWVRSNTKESYKLFKSYKVCALSGSFGPKRMEGDFQVPEGFYYINEFNAKSSYHLSLGLNYPNASDQMLSDSAKPGGEIYIHGSCVTTGCIPILDNQIEELYILTAHAKNNGQDFIPVHVFPIKFNVAKSVEKLNLVTKDDRDYLEFSNKLKEVYEYFNQYKRLPIISVNDKGEYVIM
mgnify:CR=1 FL=1